MNRETVDYVEQQIKDLEAQLEIHPYAATPNDFVLVDGEKVYNDEYLEGMPADFMGLLSRFAAFMEVKELLLKESVLLAQESVLNPQEFVINTHPRFQVNLNE